MSDKTGINPKWLLPNCGIVPGSRGRPLVPEEETKRRQATRTVIRKHLENEKRTRPPVRNGVKAGPRAKKALRRGTMRPGPSAPSDLEVCPGCGSIKSGYILSPEEYYVAACLRCEYRAKRWTRNPKNRYQQPLDR